MQGDRQVLLVEPPQALEDQFGLRPRVDEDQGRAMPAHGVVDLLHRIHRHAPAPGQPSLGHEDVDFRLGAGAALDQLDGAAGKLQPLGQRRGIGDGGGEADEAGFGRERGQSRQAQRQQLAALGVGQRMQFVDHHRLQIGEDLRRLDIGQQQRQRFGRGQQHVGRIEPLAGAAVLRRVAGARLGADLQAHLRHRRVEIARDVDRQRLQRRDVERVQVGAGLARLRSRPGGKLDQRRQEACQRFAGAGRRDQQRRLPFPCEAHHIELVRMRLPALAGEPAGENLGQRRTRHVHRQFPNAARYRVVSEVEFST